jgi:tRNA-Thr(GGU) m(6)t(6)A37 methyltransferase TsaA
MNDSFLQQLQPIAYIHTDFATKFGVPRQSGLIDSLKADIVFEPEYRDPNAFRGLEGYSYLWVIWQFSGIRSQRWSATVRPPRLGGDTRMGVFATRSPFRPNHLGLSSLKLDVIEYSKACGPVLHVSGADMMDGTPVYDIKPYLAYTDSHPDAAGGFTGQAAWKKLECIIPEPLLKLVPVEKRDPLIRILEEDPRPPYQADEDRIYGFVYAGLEIRFHVRGPLLTVTEILNPAS